MFVYDSMSQKKKEVDVLVVYGFHPFERFAVEIGRKMRASALEGIDVIEFTPASIGSKYASYEDWFREDPFERVKQSEKGKKELRAFTEEIYEKPFFMIELHDDPTEMVETQYILFFPAWNMKLRKHLESYVTFLRRQGYFGYADPSYPSVRSYHSTSIEYFPHMKRGLTQKGGLFIANELTRHLKKDYVSLFKKGFS